MQLLDCQKSLQRKINELELDIKEISIKIKDVEESSNSLFNCLRRDLVGYENQLNEQKRKTSELVEDLESSKKEICKLQDKLRNKCREVDEFKELREDLSKKFECQALKITNYEGVLKATENEMKLQSISLKQMKESVNELQGELEIKSKEVDVGKKAQKQLFQQIDQKSKQFLTVEQNLKDQKCQNNQLLLKVKELEERDGQLLVALNDKIIDVDSKEEAIKKLLCSSELKESVLVSEKKKTQLTYETYKKLKSQYYFLLKKTGLTAESVPVENKMLQEINSVTDHRNLVTLTALDNVKLVELSHLMYFNMRDQMSNHPINIKDESRRSKHPNDEEGVIFGEDSESCTRGFVTIGTSKKINRRKASPSAGTKRPASLSAGTKGPASPSAVTKGPASPLAGTKRPASPLAGTKRLASRWRETRSHANRDGPDPHDDFLNTPFGKIHENLIKIMVEKVHDLPDPVPLDVNLSSSDDENQKSAHLGSGRQEKHPLLPSPKEYKYIELVRKKAERENLKGVECNQCKKFYNAVLPNGGVNEKKLRCEHHDGVSRHRYKYTPPMTPEGFWNIGFDTEK